MTKTLKKKKKTVVPKQARAKRSYESILKAAQSILHEEGIEALNSNAIVAKAGVTTPVFYRYFEDKHDLLMILGERLTQDQETIFETSMQSFHDEPPTFERVEESTYDVMLATYEKMKESIGGLALLISLRAIPKLAKVRQLSNQYAARETAKALCPLRPDLTEDQLYSLTRVGIEIGYTAIELLLEENDLDPEATCRRAASAIISLYKL